MIIGNKDDYQRRGRDMLNDSFIIAEEELMHVIRSSGSSFEEYIKVLEKVKNLDYTDVNGNSFLHAAVCERKMDIAIDLMNRGIDINLQTVNGHTAAHLAIAGQQWDMLKEILHHQPKVNLKDWISGSSILLNICMYKSEERNEIAKELLKMGANPYAQNHKGKSPFDLALRNENQELIELFQQIPQPDHDEPEPFHIPIKARGYYIVKFNDYHKYILVENTTISYLKEKIMDYAKICGGKKVKYKFKIIPIKDTSWFMILCSNKMDFYNYHNLMSWIYGLSEDDNTPSKTICVALHKNDERLSYYGIMDKKIYGDARLFGRFQNGESFSIYLPEAYKKDGNAQTFGDVLPIRSIKKYLQFCGFDEIELENMEQMDGEEIEVEMAK